MDYLLLLRGVNVGGKHKVSMNDLKHTFEENGFKNIKTYINSGNIILESDQDLDSLRDKIAIILKSNYDFPIPFSILTGQQFLTVLENLPSWWQEVTARKDVLFYTNPSEAQTIQTRISQYTLHHERIYNTDIGIFWDKLDEAAFLKTAYHRQLIKEQFYPRITIRNGNTVNKLSDLLKERLKTTVDDSTAS